MLISTDRNWKPMNKISRKKKERKKERKIALCEQNAYGVENILIAG
jgi:hypothetical protein